MVPDHLADHGLITPVQGCDGMKYMGQSNTGFFPLGIRNFQSLEGIFAFGLGAGDHGPYGCPQSHGCAPPLVIFQAACGPGGN